MHSTITVRLAPETRKQLDNLARRLGRSSAWIINEAVVHYLERESWHPVEEHKKIDDTGTGRVIDHEEV